MEQKGIAQMAAGNRPKSSAQRCQLARLADQPQTLAAKSGEEASAGAQGQQRQRSGGAAQRGHGHQKVLPFSGNRWPPQAAEHLQKWIQTHANPKIALGQQQAPLRVAHHRHAFAHGPQHLGQGVGTRPAAQPAPKRRARLEVEGSPSKTMGGAAGLAVGLQHLHLQPVARGDGGGTKAPQATADHD